jgi:hypothetical protein
MSQSSTSSRELTATALALWKYDSNSAACGLKKERGTFFSNLSHGSAFIA